MTDNDLCASTTCPDRDTCRRHTEYVKWQERGKNTAYVLTECIARSLYTPVSKW